MPGRPRKSKKKHELQGTAQPCRMEGQGREREPEPTEGLPTAPDWLDEHGKVEWGRITTATESQWLCATDEPMVRSACMQWSQIFRMYLAGEVVTPSMWTTYRSTCQSLGFTPADRAKMQMPVAQDKPKNPFAMLGTISEESDARVQ